ncbi:MAG: GYF domain-containing protein [Chthoniobacterales bacterium]
MSSIHVARHGQSLGSFSEEEVREGIASKRFVKEDLVWRVGMSDWLPLHEVADAWGFDAKALGEIVVDLTKPPTFFEPAWERRQEVGFLASLYQTIKMALFSPSYFFSKMRTTGGIMAPLSYYLLMHCSAITITILLLLPVILKDPALISPQLAALSHKTVLGGAIGFIVLSPLIFTTAIFFSSGVMHLSLKLVRGAREPFEATFRLFCYTAGSLAILSLLPFVGGIVVMVWGLICYCIGLKKIQGPTNWQLFFAFLISPAILFFIAVVLILLVVVGKAVFLKKL